MVGGTEGALKKKGVAYIVGRANYRENARGRSIADLDGFLKLLFRQDDLKLIGVHIMGDLATDVVHIGLVAMMCNASANLFVDACLNMPTFGVLYKTATLNDRSTIILLEQHERFGEKMYVHCTKKTMNRIFNVRSNRLVLSISLLGSLLIPSAAFAHHAVGIKG